MKKSLFTILLALLPLLASAVVKRTINVAKAGTLPDLISDADKHRIQKLTLTGELNGTDIKFIREMTGDSIYVIDIQEHVYHVATNGQLTSLDISNVDIVGGGCYFAREEVCVEREVVYYYAEQNSISDYMFCGFKLKEIILPNSVTSIGQYAFSGCSGLTSITIPNSVTSIGEDAFYGTAWYDQKPDGVIYAGKVLYNYKGTMPDGTKISIKEGTLGIARSAFLNCSGLTSITIPSSVISIGCNAFSGTTWYDQKSDGVVYAGKVLYKYKGEMPEGTKISIKDGKLGIAEGAFSCCYGLASVTIPNSVTFIGYAAFSHCLSLTSVTIGSSVTSIGDHAFNHCSRLTSITIPNSVTSIGNSAFQNCYSFTSVTIGSSVTFIGSSAFSGCTGLTSITIPNSVTSIGSSAFSECSGLTSVTIGNNVKSIDSHTFGGCNNLTSMKVKSGNSVYDSRDNCNAIIETATNTLIKGCKKTVIPNSVTTIGSYAFYKCSGLSSITIPSSVTSIGSSAFYNCSGLTSVTIPNSVTFISGGTFEECTGLTSITIPNSVTSIGRGAFYICRALTDVYCYAENVPTTESSSFETSYIPNVTLHVPTGSVDAYKAVEPWNKFKEIVGTTTAKVKLNKTKATLEKGNTLTLKATVTPSTLPDKSVTWKSSNTKVATVTSNGKVKGVKAGTATITCTYVATGAKATCKVTVGYVKLNESKVAIQKGKTVTLTPTVYPSSLTDKSVVWKSTDTSVATVTSEGKVKGVKAGTAIIICTSVATSLSTTCEVTVGSVSLNKSKTFLEKGKTVTLKATVQSPVSDDKSVVWESSDKSIATVSSSGKVKGVKYGTATITCTSVATGLSATCQVTVGKVVINIPEFTLRRTRTATLVATVYPTTLSDKSVTWESSDPEIATVTSEGKVKGVKAGTATITCTSVATGLSGTCVVTVTASSESRSSEGDGDDVTGIEQLEENSATEPYDVYDLSGRKVRHQVTSLDGLPAGVYIVNRKKVVNK